MASVSVPEARAGGHSTAYEVRVIVLLGDPVGHSASPEIQNAAFAEAGVDGVYVAVRCAPEDLSGFTRGLAHDLAEHNVTVNLVAPGTIDTSRDPGAAKPAHHLINNTLTGRRGAPDDVAAMVRFLCGPGARYVTGQTIHVNGGAYFA